jgi:hypothetical protein
VRTLLILVLVSAGLSAAVAQTAPAPLTFNGVSISDASSKIRVVRRTGRCVGSKAALSECTLFDRSGVSYYVDQGRVVSMEASFGVSSSARLPFDLKIGASLNEVVSKVFPSGGATAYVEAGNKGTIITRMLKASRADYEFELQLSFDAAGKLNRITYKDVM